MRPVTNFASLSSGRAAVGYILQWKKMTRFIYQNANATWCVVFRNGIASASSVQHVVLNWTWKPIKWKIPLSTAWREYTNLFIRFFSRMAADAASEQRNRLHQVMQHRRLSRLNWQSVFQAASIFWQTNTCIVVLKSEDIACVWNGIWSSESVKGCRFSGKGHQFRSDI